MRLESSIIVRNYMEQDLYDIYNLYSDEVTMKFLKDEMVGSIEEAGRLLIEKERSKFDLAITLKDSKFVGEIKVIEIEKGIFEFSPIIKSEYLRNGYASKALYMMIDYLSEKCGATSFRAYSNKNNEAFISFLIYNGFRNKRNIGNDIEFEM